MAKIIKVGAYYTWEKDPYAKLLLEQVKLRIIADLVENCRTELEAGDKDVIYFVRTQTSTIKNLSSIADLTQWCSDEDLGEDDITWLFVHAARDLHHDK
jgi:hypothetical protein